MKSAVDKLPITLFLFMWHFLKEFKIAVAVYVFLAICAGFWGPLNSILVKNIIDLLPQANSEGVKILFIPVTLIILNFIAFDNFTWRGITYIRAKYVPVVINKMTGKLLDYVLGHSHQFFQDNQSGKISKQITNLTDGIERLLTSVIANFLRGGSLLFLAFIAAYSVNPIFCIVMVTWLVFFASASLYMSKRFVRLADAQARTESVVVGELVDSISNQSNVRIFAQKLFENARISPYLNSQQKAYTNTYFYGFIMYSIQGGLIAAMMAFSAYFLVKLYAQGLVSVGDFALIFGLIMHTGHNLWFTMSEVDEYNKAVGRCKQSLSALMEPLEIEDKSNAKQLKCKAGKISFNKVKFHYKGADPLFEDKSIDIKSGQKAGLVGYWEAGNLHSLT